MNITIWLEVTAALLLLATVANSMLKLYGGRRASSR